MKFTKLALTLLSCSVLFCGCTKDMGVALKVNDTVITKADFKKDFNRIKKIQLRHLPKPIAEADYMVLSVKSKFVNDEIARVLINQEFEKRKITASEEEIKAKTESMIKHFGSKEKFEQVLKEHDVSPERLNSDMASEVKMTKLLNAIGNKKVSDSEVEKFYKQNKDKFTSPAMVQASHILFETNKETIKRMITDADKEGKLTAEEIDKKTNEELAKTQALIKEVRKKAIANPKNFAELAKEYSTDKGSAQSGGDLGYFRHEQMVEPFSNAAFAQKVGTISQPVVSQYGTHLIYVRDKKAKTTQPYSEIKADLKQFIIEKNSREALEKLVEGLRSTAKIEYVDESLKPESIHAQINKSLPKQLKQQQKQNAPSAPEAKK